VRGPLPGGPSRRRLPGRRRRRPDPPPADLWASAAGRRGSTAMRP